VDLGRRRSRNCRLLFAAHDHGPRQQVLTPSTGTFFTTWLAWRQR
jgi:hypothetical protein